MDIDVSCAKLNVFFVENSEVRAAEKKLLFWIFMYLKVETCLIRIFDGGLFSICRFFVYQLLKIKKNRCMFFVSFVVWLSLIFDLDLLKGNCLKYEMYYHATWFGKIFSANYKSHYWKYVLLNWKNNFECGIS